MLMVRRIFTFLIVYSFCLSADTSLNSKIPLNIWQTDKSKALSIPAIEAQQTWISLNPEFSYFLYDDADIELYIRQKWTSEILDFFHALPIGAMKADLWRYLILATEGGVYSDIDSICIKPIREWPLKGRTSGPHVLLIDLDSNQSQFCQWTFASTPGHPAMLYVCNFVMRQWKKKGILRNSDGTINVLGTTGPAIFSSAIKSYIGEPDVPAFKILKKYVKDKDYRRRLNGLGIFFTNKGFFSGVGAKNLFWGSWSQEAKKLDHEKNWR